MDTASESSTKTPSAAGATPAMAQWFAAKADHPDALLFFRMGDFYELFFADAEAAAAALDIALSHRGEHGGTPIPMCGVPHHAADAYLARLIRRGFRVAIVEQMEDPKARTGKLPIKREVVRVITPGTITEETLLEAGRPNLLMAMAWNKDGLGAAWVDVSTGLFETAALPGTDLPALLGRLEPAEILAPETLNLGEWDTRRSPEPVASTPLIARRRLAEAFGAVSLDAFGTFTDGEAVAAAMALDYIRSTQSGALPRLGRPEPQGEAGALSMDAATRAQPGDPSVKGWRLGAYACRYGAADGVGRRHAHAGELAVVSADRSCRHCCASGCLVLVHRASRGHQEAAGDPARRPGHGTGSGPAVIEPGQSEGPRRYSGRAEGGCRGRRDPAATRCRRPWLDASCENPGPVRRLRTNSERALADPAPSRLEDGGVIKTGFDGELDAHRALRDRSRQVIATLQLDFAQRYGVASLKIKHHAQLGYVIEAPAVAVEKLRAFPDLTLRQGMANGARFTEAGLSDLDQRIREAAEQATARERIVFGHLVREVVDHSDELAACAEALAFLDVTQSAAALAESGRWVRPVVTATDEFHIEAGRHPVVEAALASQAAFVPNNCDLSPDRRIMLLTGPEHGGQIHFPAAKRAVRGAGPGRLAASGRIRRLGIVDRLFSRVGAADDLARGRSTFMVEMTETAAILHQAGPKSLVVVDEIGRGTSTLDGLAIAWAVLEALHSATRCRTIFATHFHELAELADRLPRLKPHTMRVKEWKGSVVFLHEVAEGAAGRSWGIHVAELAGVPAPVVRRAAALMAAMEKHGGPLERRASLARLAIVRGDAPTGPNLVPQTTEFAMLSKALDDINPDTMTPKQALDALYLLKSLSPACADGST